MSTTRSAAATPLAARPWSDVVGFVSFVALAAITAVRQPGLVLLLAPILLYEIAVATSFLIRGRAVRTSTGIPQRIAAYGGTFLMPLALPLMAEVAPQWLTTTDVALAMSVGTALRIVGLGLCVWGVWHLRRSFSVEPAARALVTSGPYAFFRHPLYVGYAATFVGGLLQRPTAAYAALTALWFVLTYMRIRYEEGVLEAAFPEYAEYRRRVGLLSPRFQVTQSRPA